MSKLLSTLVITTLVTLACAAATISKSRRDYITAHSHGWIEITVRDQQVPYAPPPESKPYRLERPDDCSLQVDLDGEMFLYETIYPVGERAPFTVDTGFRLPASAKRMRLQLTYTGCDFEGAEERTVEVAAVVDVIEAMVTLVTFNGESLVIEPATDNTAVTLEDVYEAVTRQRKR